jgi:hypothetical protein
MAKVSTVFEFPASPVRPPIYANTCLVNVTGSDVLIDFGFLDTYPATPDRIRYDADGNRVITVHPVTRVSINLNIAAMLHAQLGKIFEAVNARLGEIDDAEE